MSNKSEAYNCIKLLYEGCVLYFMDKELIRDVMRLQAILESRATYCKDCDENEFEKLRNSILSAKSIEKYVPNFLFTCRTLDQFWDFVKKPRFEAYDERRKFLYDSFNPILGYLEQEETIPSDESISRTMKEVSWDSVNSTWEKTLERRKTDPEGAVTASKTLLEDVCKCILDESGIVYSSTTSLPELCDKALKTIDLHPSQQSESSIKKLVGLCNSGCSIISEFRNKYGDSHGKGIKKETPEPKYVEFVINLAGTIAKLMIEKRDEIKASQ